MQILYLAVRSSGIAWNKLGARDVGLPPLVEVCSLDRIDRSTEEEGRV